MDFFAGADKFKKRQPNGDMTMGLQATKPIAHEYIEPLFTAGVSHMFLAERFNYVGGGGGKFAQHSVFILMDGRIEIQTGKRRKRVLEPGMVCVTPAGVYTKRVALTERVRWMFFHMRQVELWQPFERKGPRVREYEFTDCMHSIVARVIGSYYSDNIADRYVSMSLSNAILKLLKYELTVVDDAPSGRSDEVEMLHDRIKANPADNWTLTGMVEMTGMPVRTLTRHCRRVFGAAPMELVIRQRLRLACKLLAGTEKLSLDQVAARLGYSSGASFSTVFTRHMNMRPGEYRKYEGGWE